MNGECPGLFHSTQFLQYLARLEKSQVNGHSLSDSNTSFAGRVQMFPVYVNSTFAVPEDLVHNVY